VKQLALGPSADLFKYLPSPWEELSPLPQALPS